MKRKDATEKVKNIDKKTGGVIICSTNYYCVILNI